MKKIFLIVESPTKVKTLKKILGKNFIIDSSVGHIKDLPKKGLGIDIENDFEPTYEEIADKKKVITTLKKKAKECDLIYLSPDPDREGEAIAWHISTIMPKKIPIQRVVFNSITKNAVLESIKHPRDIDYALVNAQQARRVLDRIVGYKISPLLFRRIPRQAGQTLSAGRVQSVALKIVVDREIAIENFVSVEYWKISAIFSSENSSEQSFCGYLYSVDGNKVVKKIDDDKKNVMTISTQEDANYILEKVRQGLYFVDRIERKDKKRSPAPPFITSTLQQEASRHYGFSASNTMRIAQSLYEGVDFGDGGREGLITYMRTDSTRISPEGINMARKFIKDNFNSKYLPKTPNDFKKKNAQDAHEAIRPTSPEHSPETVKQFLSIDEYKLYSLIWKRFIASQMSPAIYDTISADIKSNDDIVFRLAGSTIKFDGFLAIYEEKNDEEKSQEQSLPMLKEKEQLILIESNAEQAFTKPPARFTEASLIKELEESGIGRPSTYSSIMTKIQSREYTKKENKRLYPTELGRLVTSILEKHFEKIMNIGFTASMEDSLELIAENKTPWKEIVGKFWQEFVPDLEKAEKEAFIPKVETDHKCPKCGANLNKIWSKNSYFYGCSKHPECDYSISEAEMTFDKSNYDENFDWEQKCPLCGKDMKLRHGKFGPFLGCTTYPECKGIVNIPKKGEQIPQDGPDCPAIGCDGKLIAKKSRFNKIFYTCSCYPQCDVVGSSVEKILEKYVEYPKTPYSKKKKS